MGLKRASDVWWKNAVVYCLDVETFYDSDGDGCGDFVGLTERLDHLAGIGVSCVWLMPFFPSPRRDDGYDITDFYGIDPRLGSHGDLVELIRTARDRGMRVIARAFFGLVGLTLLVPFLLGWAVTGALAGGLTALLWGGFVRIAVVNHVTWAVNSVCHTFGDRPFDIKDESRNNWLVGLLAFGEGWHHNHHAFPAMAYHGMSWRQFDLSAIIIRLPEKVHLARNVKMPSAELIERRKRKDVAVAPSIGD